MYNYVCVCVLLATFDIIFYRITYKKSKYILF